MDNSFNAGYLSSYQQGNPPHQALGSFGSLSNPSHQQESPSHATLPPLQPQNGGYQFGNLSYAHPGSQAQTPTTPHTPATSSMSSNNSSAVSHMTPTYAHSGSMLPPSSFSQPYGMTQSLQYPSSTATSLPSASSVAGLPAIRPMPPSGLPSLSSTGQFGQQPAFMQNEEAPTHVVGSQGRRGILPSAPGRPNPPAQGSAQSSKSMIPQKDQDGKFPCPHCNKTYLHAKHLKRHLLRHTGDRPYMCHLCKDTFSRSDILKRHFQKCSIRRGNPTGANHLAHQRRSAGNANRLSISQQDGPIGLAGLQEVAGSNYNGGMTTSPTVNGDISTRTSRANSIISPSGMSHRNSIAGLGILGSNVHNGEPMGSTGSLQPGLPAYSLPNATSSGSVQSNYAFNHPQMNGNVFNNQPQQMSFLGQGSSRFDNSHNQSPHQHVPNGESGQNSMDWHRVFNQGGQDGFIGSQPANASSQGMNHIKLESDSKDNFTSNESFLGSLYSHPGALGGEYAENEQGISGLPAWGFDDPLQGKVEGLIRYCFPSGADSKLGDPTADLVRGLLTVDYMKHLAEHYTSYHGHWPMLHMPTFRLAQADNSLVLAVLCIGAIYSPRLNVTQTRQMMDFVKSTVMGSCSIYVRFLGGQTHDLGTRSWEVEELQALLMIHSMFTWHGEPAQRQAARSEFPTVVRIAKAMGLYQTAPPGHYAHSALHSGESKHSSMVDVNSWDWHAWLEQEKRNRVLYLLFLTDAALCMYFNCTPQIDPLEIRLMLPADDACWDAKDWQECASTLGLFGRPAQVKNRTGTRRLIQPGMREAMRSLLEPTVSFQTGSTNVYSKFILIHALVTRIIACQKALAQPESHLQAFSPIFNGGNQTPLLQNDWLEQRPGSGSMSANSSGHGTPTDGVNHGAHNIAAQQERKRLTHALDKWKRCWDTDIDLQYPPSQTQLRRFGFSRDGVHFFYLGRSFLQSHRAEDWSAPADVRFQQVMSLLKRIKGFVVGEIETKGQDIGSVGDIDEQYGLDNLTLDMKLLFKPYNSQTDSPVSSVQTHTF